ncbi:hypothetical protein MMC27_004940 [Xylographa pallens]|nr:hypothetical protein [Xylographa pallens]
MASLLTREAVTEDDLSPVISVISWLALASMILSVLTKLILKYVTTGMFHTDDGSLVLALIFSTAQSIAFTFQITGGIGKPQNRLDSSQIEVVEKAGYAADLLFIATLAMAKTSLIIMLRELTRNSWYRKLCWLLAVFCTIWTVTSLFASAFQCHIPTPWMTLGPQCFDQISFWTYYGVINGITDVVLILLPAYMVWHVQIDKKQKLIIIACFASRIVVVGTIVVQLIFLNRIRTSIDITFEGWPYYLCTQLVQNLSIIAVCIPYLKGFLLGLESGMFRTGDFQLHKASNTPENSDGYRLRSALKGRYSMRTPNRNNDTSLSNRSINCRETEDFAIGPLDARNATIDESSAGVANWDRGSQSSQIKIIKKTSE